VRLPPPLALARRRPVFPRAPHRPRTCPEKNGFGAKLKRRGRKAGESPRRVAPKRRKNQRTPGTCRKLTVLDVAYKYNTVNKKWCRERDLNPHRTFVPADFKDESPILQDFARTCMKSRNRL
jgi:hypothetical protein